MSRAYKYLQSLLFLCLNFLGLINGIQFNKPIRYCVNSNHFHLSFDDGPHYSLTERVLDDLLDLNVSASFFVVGVMIESTNLNSSFNPLIQRMVDDGHEVGIHDLEHTDYRALSAYEISRRIEVMRQKLWRYFEPKYFRFPYGSYNDQSFEAVKQRGLTVVHWSYDSRDWAIRQPQILIQNLNSFLQPYSGGYNGGVIGLFHDIQSSSVEVVRDLVQLVRQAGYELVDLRTCLGD